MLFGPRHGVAGQGREGLRTDPGTRSRPTARPALRTTATPGFLAGGGEAGALMRARDWAATALGAPDGWPQPLKTLVGVILAAGQPMCIIWGPERTYLYNDRYAPILGRKHPAGLGEAYFDVWPEVREAVAPLLDRVDAGEAIQMDDLALTLERRDPPEEAHFSFSFTPVRDETGAVAGVFCPVMETTAHVMRDRRLATERLRQQRLLQQMPGFVCVLSGPTHVYDYVNDAYVAIAGQHDFLGRTVRDVLPELEGQDRVELLDQVYATGVPFLARDLPIHVAGDDRFIDMLVEPILDDAGGITGLFVGGYDVTERMRVERALAVSEARLRAITDSIDQMIWSTLPDGYHDFYNQRWYDFTGVPKGSTDGEAWNGMFHPDDQERAWARWRHSLDTGDLYEIEYRLRHRSGGYRWVLGRAVAMRGEAGDIVRWFGTCTDIQDIVEAREVLKQSALRLEREVAEGTAERKVLADIVEGTDALVLVLDLNYGILALNKANADEFKRIYGVRPKVGDNLLGLLADQPEHQAAVRAAWAPALAGEEFTFTEAFGDPQRARPHYEIKFNTLRDDNGDRIGAYQFTCDVTGRLRAQAIMEANQARLSTIFETSYQYQALIGADGNVLEVNSTALEGIKSRPDDVVGKPFWETPWFTETPGMPQAVQAGVAHVAAGNDFRQEVTVNLPIGQRMFDFSMRPVRDASGVVVAIVPEAVDITARRQAEDALRQSQKLEAMGQLTGGVAHDFNNLLTPIIGGLDMLQRRGLGGEREQRLIEGALQSADRAKTLVQRLLSFARRQPLQSVSVDMASLVTGMADMITSTTGPQIEVVVDVARDLPAARADPNQLEMAILNLSVNARDAMPSGGTLRISATAETIEPGHRTALEPGLYVRLSVADTGVGMDEATLAKAIEPFFSTKGVGKGTGLGLSMAHGLASQLGGALMISSRPGLGTDVEVWLPVKAGALPLPDEDPPTVAPKLVGTALLVDDDPLVRMSTADMLTDLGFAVVEAASAEAALVAMDEGVYFDVLVTDHLMPGMTGVDLAGLVQTRRPGVPVLLVSGFAETEGVDATLPRLIKPFRQVELAASLIGLMGIKAE